MNRFSPRLADRRPRRRWRSSAVSLSARRFPRLAVLTNRRLIGRLTLEVGRGRVEEQQVDLKVQQVRGLEVHLLRKLVLDLQQPVHRPGARVLIQLVQAVDPCPLTQPVAGRELRERLERPVGDHREDHPLCARIEPPALQPPSERPVDRKRPPLHRRQVGSHRGRHRPSEQVDDPPDRAGARSTGADHGDRLLRGASRRSDRPERPASDPLRGPVPRRVLHPWSGCRTHAQPEPSRWPPAQADANRGSRPSSPSARRCPFEHERNLLFVFNPLTTRPVGSRTPDGIHAGGESIASIVAGTAQAQLQRRLVGQQPVDEELGSRVRVDAVSAGPDLAIDQ
jgi:hypothetical protein